MAVTDEFRDQVVANTLSRIRTRDLGLSPGKQNELQIAIRVALREAYDAGHGNAQATVREALGLPARESGW